MRLSTIAARVAWPCALAASCRDATPLRDFPPSSRGRLPAVFALRAADCDGNLAALTLFDRPSIAAGLTLAGVVLVDGDSAEPRLRTQLRAYDVGAPPLHLSAATRDSLAVIVRQLGPAIVILDRATHTLRAIPAPQSPRQLMQLTTMLDALSARTRRAP